MRFRLALIAVIGLLPGAALPPAATLQSVFECLLGLQAARAATEPLVAVKEIDRSQPPGDKIVRYFDPPAGLTVFGLTPGSIASGESFADTYRRVMIVTIVQARFETVEAAVLAAHGLNSCPRRMTGGQQGCEIFYHEDQPEQRRLMLLASGDVVSIACAYTPDAD